jgi:hypothetical protein
MCFKTKRKSEVGSMHFEQCTEHLIMDEKFTSNWQANIAEADRRDDQETSTTLYPSF